MWRQQTKQAHVLHIFDKISHKELQAETHTMNQQNQVTRLTWGRGLENTEDWLMETLGRNRTIGVNESNSGEVWDWFGQTRLAHRGHRRTRPKTQGEQKTKNVPTKSKNNSLNTGAWKSSHWEFCGSALQALPMPAVWQLEFTSTSYHFLCTGLDCPWALGVMSSLHFSLCHCELSYKNPASIKDV